MSTHQNVAQTSSAPLYINDTQVGYMHVEGTTTGSRMQMHQRMHLKRGDTLQTRGRWSGDMKDNYFQITRLN